MLRSMYAGVTGLRAHQTMMDVVGNNISNVNTAGYKASRATFQESLNQVIRGAAGTAAARAGTNPLQVGLGTTVGAIDTVFSQGASQLTGRGTDLAIEGQGFFVAEVDGTQLYTRAGAFGFDSEGNLTGPVGSRIQGFMGPNPAATDPLVPIVVDPTIYGDVTVAPDGTVVGTRRDNGAGEIVGRIALGTFTNPGGLVRMGNGLYAESLNSNAADVGFAGELGRGQVQAGLLEMSNVDLAQEFTNLIVAQRGFQANARTITTSDEMLQELVNLKR